MGYPLQHSWASLVAQTVKNQPAMQETSVQSLGWEDSPGGGQGNPLWYSCLENPHGQRSLAGYSPQGCKGLDMTTDQAQLHLRASQPTCCFLMIRSHQLTDVPQLWCLRVEQVNRGQPSCGVPSPFLLLAALKFITVP